MVHRVLCTTTFFSSTNGGQDGIPHCPKFSYKNVAHVESEAKKSTETEQCHFGVNTYTYICYKATEAAHSTPHNFEYFTAKYAHKKVIFIQKKKK